MTASTAPADDAPATASKDDKVVEAAADGLLEPRGNMISGRTATINRSAQELFDYWRDFRNLETFMENVVRIDIKDATRSHWVVKAPAGKTVEWDSVVTQEADGKYIAWASEEGADVANSGRVDFKDAGGRGTAVTLMIAYSSPGGAIGKLVATLFQREPELQARRDLRRFKQLMETGEIAVSSWTNAQANAEKE